MPPPRQKNNARADDAPARPDARALIEAQSVRLAVVAGLAGIAAMSGLWVVVTVATDRVFPWFTILEGAVIGRLVCRYGRGIDYRFPLIAAGLACAGALIGNLVVALPETTEELGVSAWQVVRGLTWWSFEVFFDELITPVDYIYAAFGAVLAAYYARRRLDRHQEFALRTMDGRPR